MVGARSRGQTSQVLRETFLSIALREWRSCSVGLELREARAERLALREARALSEEVV